MISTSGRTTALVIALLTLPACAPDHNRLWGNIQPTYSLDFDQVRAYRMGDLLVVAYEKAFDPLGYSSSLGRPVMNQVVRLTVRMDLLDSEGQPAVQPQREFRIDQKATDHDGRAVRVGSLERYVVEVDGQGELADAADFPALEQATATLDRLGQGPGDMVAGSFSARFVSDRTLGGELETTLVAP
jgi:hypothetical protein